MQNQRRAVAHILGGSEYECLSGKIEFYQSKNGVWVIANVGGLPENETGFFAMHIHDGSSCSGENFSETGSHYNPENVKHPLHSGDLPPLLASNGNAYMAVLTNRFTVDEIMGKTVVIHMDYDDFTSQPAGNAGDKIACGVIKSI